MEVLILFLFSCLPWLRFRMEFQTLWECSKKYLSYGRLLLRERYFRGAKRRH